MQKRNKVQKMLPAKALENDKSLVVDVLTLCEILVQEIGSHTEDYIY
jgi:hypothetical protein